ncbi:MAG: flagellar motor protein MotB [Deltaproteobacteria bacterium]|nr:flagellar motor protein MotB [Deltaproteobacteria bacterium]
MKKKIQTQERDQGKWLLTFNDMMTLILTFFVMILSMSVIDTTKIQGASSSASKVFGLLGGGGQGIQVFNPFVFSVKDRDIERAKKQAREGGQESQPGVTGPLAMRADLAATLNKIPGIKASVVNKNVSLSLDENLLFQSASAEIKSADDPSLRALCLKLKDIDASVRVEGNTDDLPIKNDQYPSNWELSTARAVNVVKYLISAGIAPERLSAVGYGPSKPVAQNSDEQNRTLNRRVDIVLTFGES